MRPQIYIGTSGWNYKHWEGIFYPKKYPKSKWLEFYASHYTTVELNASFYRLPTPKTFEGWRERTPDTFLWAVKANRYITHIKRLKSVEEPLQRFFNAIKHLGAKLGPILFQIPPNLSFDEETLDLFCKGLKKNLLYSIEIRHPSWAQKRAIETLKDNNIALCISDSAGRYPYIEKNTASFFYIRLHGSKKLYSSEYSEEELQAYARKITGWKKDTYIYFDNDYGGYAINNSKRLREILGLS